MGIIENDIERKNIVNFFVNDLKYIEISADLVSKDLFIKSELLNFIKENNSDNFKDILKEHFKNDENSFYNEFKKEILLNMRRHSNHNNAFILRQGIYFKGKLFNLFNHKNNLMKDKCSFDKNKFIVVSQFNVKLLDLNGVTIPNFEFIPDLTFFINGIYIGYMEIKFRSNGQTTKNGNLQILEKYFASYNVYKNNIDKNKNYREEYKDFKQVLNIFYSSLFISSFDLHTLYQIRNFKKIEDEMHNLNLTLDQINTFNKQDYNVFLKLFEEYKNNNSCYETLLKENYSKETLYREILYFNYGERKQDGNNNQTELITPRLKQKIGVEKVLEINNEYLENENNPFYLENKVRETIKFLPINEQEEVLREYQLYHSNKNINSILLAYSTGFGKTKIISWLSLFLKDLIVNEKYVYNTIFLITDRLELKTQTNDTIKQMNISKGMFSEIQTTKEFERCLTENNKRIVIVNIQKFQKIIDKLDDKVVEKLKQNRNVFIIDEIHRSNDGSQHSDMMTIFNDKISKDNLYLSKKNLVIGLTATPSNETIKRFGECIITGKTVHYKPHDEYTMIESINDGYTLDFRNSISAVATSMMVLVKEEKYDENGNLKKQNFDKNLIYENDERVLEISKIIVDHLLNSVYKQINGNGKAMLTCQSITCAIKHYQTIKKLFEEKTQLEEYKKYADREIFIVFTDTQFQKAKNICKISEKESIQRFKENQNGLMIVVEKLLTGFDVPLLHTLFLNKEVKDISAIQALSRVNRTTKYKNSCHIIDFSHENINTTKNLPKAINNFFGHSSTSFTIDEPLNVLIKTFKELNNFYLYKENKNEFELYQNNVLTNEYILLETKLIKEIEINRDEIGNIIKTYYNYKAAINDLKFIYDTIQYQNENLENFYKVICNLIRNNNENKGVELEIGLLSIGEIDPNLKYSKNRSKKDGENESKEFNKDWESILNNKSEKIEVQILDFKNFVSELFKEIYLRAQKDGKCFKIQINDNNYNEELLEKEFDKQLTFFKLAKNYLITYENKHKYIEIIKNELKYSFHKFKEYLKTI